MAATEDQSSAPVSACLFKENPYRLVSLWDMLAFKAGDIYGRITALTGFAAIFLKPPSLRVADLLDVERAEIIKALESLTKEAPGSPFAPISILASRLIAAVNGGDPNLQANVLADRIFAMLGRFKEICEEQAFFFVPKDDVQYLEPLAMFGSDFEQRFPSAVLDAREAGKCLALDRPTASAFHLMRVAEFGLRALAKTLHIKVTHKGRNHKIEHADWEKIINGCKNKLDQARQMAPSDKRKTKLKMYSDAADHCAFMKDIWRNDLSHTGRSYDRVEAMVVMDRVRAFMIFLAKMLS